MPDKRRGFRNFSTFVFFGLSSIVIILTAALVLYQMMTGANRQSDFNFDSAVASAKREVARVKSSLKNPADSLRKPGEKIIVTGDEYHPVEIHDSLFSFEVNYDSTKNGIGEWQNFIRSVDIYHLPDHKKIQTAVPPEIFPFESYNIPIIVEDMNFDGYSDFRVMNGFMTRGQTFYNFWLYDPAKGKFKADTFLSNNMWDVAFDHEAKTVTSNQRLVGPFDVINEVYTWEEGKLALQHREESQGNPFGGEDGDITMIKRIDGKLVERSKHFDTIPITPYGSVIFDWEKLK